MVVKKFPKQSQPAVMPAKPQKLVVVHPATVLGVNVAETKREEKKEADEEALVQQEDQLIESLQDGTYFDNMPEETKDPETPEVSEAGETPEENAAVPEDEEQAVEPEGEAAAPSDKKETAKEKFEHVMDWLTADQMRLTIILTAFCMICWMVVKLIKK